MSMIAVTTNLLKLELPGQKPVFHVEQSLSYTEAAENLSQQII